MLFESVLPVQFQNCLFCWFSPAFRVWPFVRLEDRMYVLLFSKSECTMSRLCFSVFLFFAAKVDHGGGPKHIWLGPPPWSTLASENRKTEILDIVHSDQARKTENKKNETHKHIVLKEQARKTEKHSLGTVHSDQARKAEQQKQPKHLNKQVEATH